ncbi:MAG: NADP-reducing hydrogenase subunit HndC [Pelotomaculum sp. PtaB.Bin104]|nr:MAG: NADP-reducing hydrogenase subunit HndC [Pelotomaculum sp. PtaB.Bin104]OPX88753.1 MAG: NADP-reducing hydrogenase subunit HndC [Pelotomaculum sp. PtaB.Bin104]
MKSLEELAQIKAKRREALKIRDGIPSETEKAHIMMCGGAGCISSKCTDVVDAMKAALAKNGIADQVQIILTGCMGPCDMGPVAIVYPDGTFYSNLKPKNADAIVEEHIMKGNVVQRLLYRAPGAKEPTPNVKDIDLFAKQKKIVLRNNFYIDPTSIEDYIANDGYAALGKALTQMTPEGIIEEVKKAGIRGRGGAGFPSGMKWSFTAAATGSPKYVVCNGDEGDPGAFMDRSVLEGDPHSVIEGMAICGRAIGAEQGYVYVRAEYPLAIERLEMAIAKARENGLLGKDILGSGFNFDIEIRIGAGAFVCGEETALLTSIEGKRGEPRPRPPFPANAGVWGKPTVLNNVETWANIPEIILKGADWYASIGTEKSKGTKVFALAGRINNTGIVEVPMGTTLREIVFDIGGGIPRKKEFKAVQTGGPSGGCIPAAYLDTPVDYDSLGALGAIMGSGGMIVMDQDTCMVDIAKFFIDFIVDESCGKCSPCRLGTKRMYEILERITTGKGREGDIELLEELGAVIKSTALCGLGQTAPNPILSTIRYFRDEYEAHIKEHKCAANVCEFEE